MWLKTSQLLTSSRLLQQTLRKQELSRLYEGLQQSQQPKLSHIIRCIYKCKQAFKRPVQVSLSVQGYTPPLTPWGWLQLLLAGDNPEKAAWLPEIGSGGKQVIHTSETNAAHCLLQLNIHRSLSQDIHTSSDGQRETEEELTEERESTEEGELKGRRRWINKVMEKSRLLQGDAEKSDVGFNRDMKWSVGQ